MQPGASFDSRAFGVSDDGSTVVGRSYSTSGSEAFVWTSGTGIVGLGDLPGGGFASWAYDVSADGLTVVGRSESESGQEAFIWESTHGMRELDVVLTNLGLDLVGWTLEAARGVSADGKQWFDPACVVVRRARGCWNPEGIPPGAER